MDAPDQGASLHNREAEEAVIGAALLSSTARRVALDHLTREAFVHPALHLIFAAIEDLDLVGVPVDPVTVADRLMRTGNLARVGGATVLADLVSAVPATSNVAWYAEIVADLHNRREAIKAWREAIRRASDLRLPFDDSVGLRPRGAGRHTGGVDV